MTINMAEAIIGDELQLRRGDVWRLEKVTSIHITHPYGVAGPTGWTTVTETGRHLGPDHDGPLDVVRNLSLEQRKAKSERDVADGIKSFIKWLHKRTDVALCTEELNPEIDQDWRLAHKAEIDEIVELFLKGRES